MEITAFFNNLIDTGELKGFMFACVAFAMFFLFVISMLIDNVLYTKRSLRRQAEDNRQKEFENENLKLKNEQLSIELRLAEANNTQAAQA